MNNHTGDFALYTNPKVALEVMEKLKAATPKQFSVEQTLAAFGALTERDLLFYELGRTNGLKEALALVGVKDEDFMRKAEQ
jgi:hypothetical protein